MKKEGAEKMGALSYQAITRSWFYRFKLYHIPFWCIYHYVWLTVAFGNPLKAANNIFDSPYGIKYSFYVIFEALAVYFNLYFLMPRLLEKRKFTLYFISLSLTVLATALLIVFGYYFSSFATGKSLKALYGEGGNCFYYFMGYALPSAFASMTLAMTIKLTNNWLQTERTQQLLEKDKLETELKLLKQQFNPHFLFNSINSIFFLIHKNPNKASDSLAKFSDLLRHQLYECNDPQISLSKEIGYLTNFVELEKLRQGSSLKVEVETPGAFLDHLGIAPFILMTFVENAFKHVSQNSTGSWIRIRIASNGLYLNLQVANSKSAQDNETSTAHKGIGLNNVKRRLDLVYPGKYILDLADNHDEFEVRLGITLTELAYQNMTDYAFQPEKVSI